MTILGEPEVVVAEDVLAFAGIAQPIDAKRLHAALAETFAFRKTHALPEKVPEPLGAWAAPYAAMAREDQLAWLTLEAVTKAARTFLDPVLAGELDATWEPEAGSWNDQATQSHEATS